MNNEVRRLQPREREHNRQVTNNEVVNSRSAAQTTEIRHLNDSIRRLLTENEELCDLCCFLDDDRQRYQRDAAEWQRLHQKMASEITVKVLQFIN